MINSNAKYKRLGKNTFLVFIGNIGPRLISFILLPLYTYWMSEADFGIQDLISVYNALLIPFITLCVSEALFVFPKNQPKSMQKKYFTVAFGFTFTFLINFLLIWFLLPYDIKHLVLPDKVLNYSSIFLMLVSLDSFQRLTQSFTRSIDRMKVYSLSGMIYAMTMFILALILVPKYSLDGYWISIITSSFVSLIYTFIAIKGWSYFCRLSEESFSILKEMLRFSIPLLPNSTMWWIINSINRPFLISSVGLTGLGLYSVAGRLPSIISIVFSIFFNAFQISALEEYNNSDFKNFFNNIFRTLLIIQCTICFIFELFGDLIFEIFIDKDFFQGAYYLPILSVGVILANFSAFVGVVFTVVKKTKYFFFSSILAAIVSLVTNVLLIPKYGIMGACVAIIISQTTMLVYRYWKAKQYTTIQIDQNIIISSLTFVLSIITFYSFQNIFYRNSTLILLIIIFFIINKSILCKSLETLKNLRIKKA